jgi:hypothetical protein
MKALIHFAKGTPHEYSYFTHEDQVWDFESSILNSNI